MTELLNRCDGCVGDKSTVCDIIFRLAVANETSDTEAMASLYQEEERPDLMLDAAQAMIIRERTGTYEGLNDIACTLSKHQIDENVSALKG